MSFQSYLDNVEAKTGKSAADLKALAIERGLADDSGLAPGVKSGAVIDWLKGDFDLGHGHAMSIVAFIKGKRA
ncbi:DUF4287 domain-containing protein [Sphingopyxis sp.]|uniref:DUF4287 domain-containing protein n=1 Tax=Sphingopyxis sp. TaxID=1908224 RepID=UPI001DC39337|nr:DUF4287 domain-containing protein [Sphingopyxis sp.]MBW8294234.1 DUF4287 domain-containing protein [Sphingopyxis sp.]